MTSNLLRLRSLCVICTIIYASLACRDDELYVIRSAAPPGLVLEANNSSTINLQHFNGFNPQLWRFERGHRVGLYHIVNQYTGKSLEILKNDNGHHLIMRETRDVLQQQWSVTLKGRIANAEYAKNVDVWKSNFTAGAWVNVWEDNGAKAQEFALEKKV